MPEEVLSQSDQDKQSDKSNENDEKAE